ncbi:MAG: tetratricopeptide repeat protein [Polyangiaceae bacterium]
MRRTIAAASVGIALTMSSVFLGGCATEGGNKMQADLATYKRDHNSKRMIEYGKGFAAVGDLTRAEEYFTAALDSGGDDTVITPMLLRVCIQDGRYRVAIQYGETFLRRHPNDVRTRFVLATLYLAIADNVAARAQFERVLAARPEEADAHFALAVLMRDSQEDLLSADHHFREYLRLKPGGAHAEEAQSSLLKSVTPEPGLP